MRKHKIVSRDISPSGVKMEYQCCLCDSVYLLKPGRHWCLCDEKAPGPCYPVTHNDMRAMLTRLIGYPPERMIE